MRIVAITLAVVIAAAPAEARGFHAAPRTPRVRVKEPDRAWSPLPAWFWWWSASHPVCNRAKVKDRRCDQ